MYTCPECHNEIVNGDSVRFKGQDILHADCNNTIQNPVKQFVDS